MQNLAATPLCAIQGDIVGKHQKFFHTGYYCSQCGHVQEACNCDRTKKKIKWLELK